MRTLSRIGLGTALLTLAAQAAADDWQPLFNGRDLTGWVVACQAADREQVFWKVEDGAIVCDSLDRPKHNYVWLRSVAEFGDFELKLKFQCYRDSPGNSGVQFRSRYDEGHQGGWLDGPQVDIHSPAAMSWRTGLIYDETREERRWVCPSLKNWTMEPRFKPADYTFKYSDDGDGWNDLELSCQGLRVKTVLNGTVMVDWDGCGVLDNLAHQTHRVGRTGHFALQLHAGDRLKIRFKDLLIRAVTGG